MNRVIHFEIHADNLERARHFYSTVFGWHFVQFPGPTEYWLITTGSSDQPGIDGGLIARCGPPPTEGQAVFGFVCTMDVKSVDEAAGKIAVAGGTIVVPKMPIPGVGWVAYAKDTEGNIFGIHQADPTVK